MSDETKNGPTPPHMAGGKQIDPAKLGTVEQPKPAAKAASAKTEAPEPEARLHPILTNEEVLDARAKARAKIEAEQKAFALAEVERKELTRLREEEFITVGGVEDELVNITIDLPEFGSCLTTNMRPYWHGQTYLVARHVARDLTWRMQAMWQHQLLQIDGKKLRDTYYRNASLNLGMRETRMSARTGAVTNEPRRPV